MKKFTLFLTMLLTLSTFSSMAQITSLDELSNDKVYWLHNYYSATGSQPNRRTLYYSEEYPELLWCAYVFNVEDNMEDPNQQIAILKHEDKYYLYSPAAGKYVTRIDGGLHLVDTPCEALTIVPSEAEGANGYFCFAFNNKWLFGSYPFDGYSYCGYIYSDGTNKANAMYSWLIYEAGDFDSSELMAALPGQVEEYAKAAVASKEELAAAIEAADILIYDEANYEQVSAEPYPLQVTDPTAPYYLSCSNVDPVEGSMAELIDGDNSTFMHSNWHTVSAENDWLDIDLGSGNELSEFQFDYHSRQGAGNDFPSSILIQGSNDGTTYTDITTVSGLPITADTHYYSDAIKSDEAYRYLRFIVTTNSNRIYFHMAEFNLTSLFSHLVYNEEYASLLDKLKELLEVIEGAKVVLEDENSLKADYDEQTAAINEIMQFIADVLAGGPDEEVLASVDEAKELLDLPRLIGYPGEASRATLKAVIDEVMLDPSPRQREVMTAAIDAFYNGNDVIVPEDGKKYTMTFESRIGSRFYMNRIEEEQYLTDSEGNDSIVVLSSIELQAAEEGVEYPETAVFTCRHNNDSTNTLTFIADNGQYLLYRDGTASAAGNARYGIQAYEDEYTQISLIRIIPTSYAIADTYEDFWGYVAWYSKRSEARGYGCIVTKTDGSGFDGASAPFYNDGFTSAIRVTEYNADGTNIEAIESATTVKGIYDLFGRRVENPVKGIYIVNGKKTFIK